MTDLTMTTSPAAGTETRLKQAQAIAGALFGTFVLIHLSNIAIAPFGVDAFNTYQRALRQFYQHPIIELLVVMGPLLVHAGAGIWLYFIRRQRPMSARRPLLQRLHTWAGCFLLLVIVGHVLAVRGPSFFYGVFPEFEGLSFSLWYFPAYFYPYYFLLALAGFYHATNGLRTLAARQGVRISRDVQVWATVIAALWILVALLSLGGVLTDVGNQSDHGFAQLTSRLTGMDPRVPIR